MFKIKVNLEIEDYIEGKEYGKTVCQYDRNFTLEYKDAKSLFDTLAKQADETEETE